MKRTFLACLHYHVKLDRYKALRPLVIGAFKRIIQGITHVCIFDNL